MNAQQLQQNFQQLRTGIKHSFEKQIPKPSEDQKLLIGAAFAAVDIIESLLLDMKRIASAAERVADNTNELDAYKRTYGTL